MGLILVLAVAASNAGAQAKPPKRVEAPPATAAAAPAARTETVVAGPGFRGAPINRWLMGNMYRDLWTTPIEVPVLDITTFAGGLRPIKRGGGMQTKTLRFANKEGLEYTFRCILKDHAWTVPEKLNGTFVESLSKDQRSSTHPAAAAIVAPLFAAAGVMTPQPQMVFMPRDVDLGEFTKDFAGQLGWIEQYPNKPDSADGFAGPAKIIDSEALLKRLNEDPTERVDSKAYLTARLVDMLVGDWDRHWGQWKWARVGRDDAARWVAIPRDHDMALATYEGVIGAVGGKVIAFYTPFSAKSGNARSLLWDSFEMDRRLLAPLSKAEWDAVVGDVMRNVNHTVIDSAVRRMPRPWLVKNTTLAATLKERRERLPELAHAAYARVNEYVDLHATDALDRAVIEQRAGGFVDVQLETEKGVPVFSRRYDARETKEIRVYLHDGDDWAVARGDVRSIPVRVIGGDGNNTLLDSTRARGAVRFYDQGNVKGNEYGEDSLFNRQHWEEEDGKPQPPGKDRGTALQIGGGLSRARGMGFTPRLSVARLVYGFETRPYVSRLYLSGTYAEKVHGWRIVGEADRRFEGSPLHLTLEGRFSHLEMLNFHGLGNQSPDSGVDHIYFETRQRLLTVYPAVALALGTNSDLSLGPIVQHSKMDETIGRNLAATQPYGTGSFGQAGVQAVLHHEKEIGGKTPKHKYIAEVTAAAYPAVWDVQSAFQTMGVAVEGQTTLPVVTNPVLALRAGGKRVFGDFPFYEAAFVGGNRTARYMEPQRYAGDASVYASAEVRVPLSGITRGWPFDWGVLGLGDVGRVYVDGDSPGGWHSVSGYGLWFGMKGNRMKVVTLTMVSEVGRTGLHLRTGLGF
jgi:hypothetical protein